MVSADNSSTSEQKPDRNSDSVGKYLTNVLYLATILFIFGFIWQSIAPFIRS